MTASFAKSSRPIAFLDLDGTLRNTGESVYPRAHELSIYAGIPERLSALRQCGYLLAGVTNQGGISMGVIKRDEVEAANARTQELLGETRLDLILYCPHHYDEDQRYCDCKKPMPGMGLDTLSALPDSTLDGAFMVGDMPQDRGFADALGISFLPATEFRRIPPEQIVQWARRSVGSNQTTVNPSRVAGVLVGMAVGDAMGAPLEFMPRTAARRMYPAGLREMIPCGRWAAGEYTDDTQMALLVARSFIECKRLDPPNLAHLFKDWAGTAKDVGLQTSSVLKMRGYVEAPERVAAEYYTRHSENSAGNGAVMRCAPVALFHLESRPMLLADSRRSARLTHADPKAQSSCVLVNVLIAEALLHGTKDARGIAMASLAPLERSSWERLDHIEALSEEDISSSGYTVSTVEAAVWSFLTTDSFEEAVVRAANLGDDADTVAAVTGALAGAYYGNTDIPRRWREVLWNEPEICALALKLAGQPSNIHADCDRRVR